MSEGEKIREVRIALKLTLEEFGSKVGVTKAAMSNIEKGNRNVTEQMRKAICREFNVNYNWLIDGDGDDKMFSDLPQTVLDELCRQYNLDDFDKSIIEMYIGFPEPMRKQLKEKIKEMVKKSEGNVPESAGTPEPTTEELEAEYKKSSLNSARNTGSAASSTTDGGKNNGAAV